MRLSSSGGFPFFCIRDHILVFSFASSKLFGVLLFDNREFNKFFGTISTCLAGSFPLFDLIGVRILPSVKILSYMLVLLS